LCAADAALVSAPLLALALTGIGDWVRARRPRLLPEPVPTVGVTALLVGLAAGPRLGGPGGGGIDLDTRELPLSAIAANPSTVYVADQRGVLQLSGSKAEDNQSWSEVRPLMVAGAVPVLPG
jgi:hypothetical protein